MCEECIWHHKLFLVQLCWLTLGNKVVNKIVILPPLGDRVVILQTVYVPCIYPDARWELPYVIQVFVVLVFMWRFRSTPCVDLVLKKPIKWVSWTEILTPGKVFLFDLFSKGHGWTRLWRRSNKPRTTSVSENVSCCSPNLSKMRSLWGMH